MSVDPRMAPRVIRVPADDARVTARLYQETRERTSHEHDIRAAVGRPGARDSDAVWHSSDQLLTHLRTPVPLLVTMEDGEYLSGPGDDADFDEDPPKAIGGQR